MFPDDAVPGVLGRMVNRRFHRGVLERDFEVLYGPKAHWIWPFYEGDLFGTLVNIGISTFMVSLLVGLFVHINFDQTKYIALGVIVFLWELVRLNWTFLREQRLREQLRKKYIPIIEHTEAYWLLEGAIELRKRGIIDGYESKQATELDLKRLWLAAFAETETLNTPLTASGVLGDPLKSEPVKDQIGRYFQERSVAYEELQH